MPRSIASALETVLRSTSSAHLVWLIEIPTGLTSPATLRYATAPYALTWDSLAWSPIPAAPPTQQFDAPGGSGGRSLSIGDADLVIANYIEAGALFEGQTVIVRLTDLSRTGGSGSDAIEDDYVIESVQQREGSCTFNLRPQLGTFDRRVPRRLTTRALFPGLAPGPLS